MRRVQSFFLETPMTDDSDRERDADGIADSIAATAIISVAVLIMYIWLAGMPS